MTEPQATIEAVLDECPDCKGSLEYIEGRDAWYCHKCRMWLMRMMGRWFSMSWGTGWVVR